MKPAILLTLYLPTLYCLFLPSLPHNLITMHDTTSTENTNDLNAIKHIINIRDLSQNAENKLPYGLIYRSGSVSKASEEDANIITNQMKIKTFIDLRGNTEVRFQMLLHNIIYNCYISFLYLLYIVQRGP